MNKFSAAVIVAAGLALGASAAWANDYPADNTGKNVRDRNAAQVTADDQSNAKSDLVITQQIRQSVVADSSLSMNAHNVKIVTKDGAVTLRGPVKNDQERLAIQAKAQAVAGVTRVNNELEVTKN